MIGVALRTSVLEGLPVKGAAKVTVIERKRMIAVNRVLGVYIRERIYQSFVGEYRMTCRKDRVCRDL